MRVSCCLASLVLLLALGCADNPGPTLDGGSDAGDIDSGSDVDAGPPDSGPAPDAGPPLPERCSDENMFFEDEFGRMAFCIYVAEDGDDAAAGTPDAPFASISRAIEVAIAQSVATGRVHAVAVSRGSYDERVELASGVSLYGKFDADDNWSRAEGNETSLENDIVVDGRIEGLVADGIAAPTVVEGFTIRGGTAPADMRGVDVYGVRVADSNPTVAELGGLLLRDLVVSSGNGSTGEAGVAGTVGDPGVIGTDGDPGDKDNGDRTPGGPGGVAICATVTTESTRGGVGGEGGGDNLLGCGNTRDDAQVGGAPAALSSCGGGTAGEACECGFGGGGGVGNACATEPATDGAAADAPVIRGAVVEHLFVPRDGPGNAAGEHGVGGS
ncbi:MAG: hypothetical protein AB8I08_40995, partial [Sandaracinaceae bacterium]